MSETAGNKATKLGIITVCGDLAEVATCMSRVTFIDHDLRLCLKISRLTSLRFMDQMQSMIVTDIGFRALSVTPENFQARTRCQNNALRIYILRQVSGPRPYHLISERNERSSYTQDVSEALKAVADRPEMPNAVATNDRSESIYSTDRYRTHHPVLCSPTAPAMPPQSRCCISIEIFLT